MLHLAVHGILAELHQALQDPGRAVLVAPPGSGKTTVVPLSLLDAPWLASHQRIVLLEPRRLAARLAARFMADQLGEPVGQRVGYRVRFETCISERTRIEVVTGGVFLRRIQSDPELADVGLVVFDEFHERGLDSDLALALTLDVAAGLRPDLRILLMSATIDLEATSSLLDGAPAVVVGGSPHPVACHFRPGADEARFDSAATAAAVAAAVQEALAGQPADILAFLPGIAEIRRCCRLLETMVAHDVDVLPLHGNLPLDEQAKIVRKGRRDARRVILATTIAETSLTIEGIGVVIDCGWKRVPAYDPASGLSRLKTTRVSKASADQRRGRAGRLGPGSCFRLWSKHIDQGLIPYDQPEIRQAELSGLILQLAEWGVDDSSRLRWLDALPGRAEQEAKNLLSMLGALDEKGRATTAGRLMARLPLHPRLAAMVVFADAAGMGGEACDLAALLSEDDLRLTGGAIDLDRRLQLMRTCPTGRATGKDQPVLAERVLRTASQLRRLINHRRVSTSGHSALLLASAYPDRIARREEEGEVFYKLANGRRVMVDPSSRLRTSEWLAVGEVDGAIPVGRVRCAVPISPEELRTQLGDRITETCRLEWDPSLGKVRGRRITGFANHALEERPWPEAPPEQIVAVLLQAVREQGLDLLPWTPAVRLLQARVCCLRGWQPEVGWPDFGMEALLAELDIWLAPHLQGERGFARLKLKDALESMLSWDLRQRLERDAPTHLPTPAGSRIALRYHPEEAPVMAVRLQEMFGLAQTPRIAGGRVEVLLHLLSPAGRPVQVTRDLAGFWNSAYHMVRKELQGRYPKHHWPEDPWQAVPTTRAKPRRERDK